MPFVKERESQVVVGPLKLEVQQGWIPPHEIRMWEGNPRIRHLVAGLDRVPDGEDLIAFVQRAQPTAYANLRNDIMRFGQQEPVFVRPLQPDGEPVDCVLVVEGNTRAAILKELSRKYPKDGKFSRVKAYLLPYDFPDTQLAILMANYHVKGTLRNQWDRYQIGGYVYEQVKQKKLFTAAEIAEMMGKSASWVSRLLSVFEFAVEYRDELEGEYGVVEIEAELETNQKFSLLEEAWKVKDFRDRMDAEPEAKKTLFRWVHLDKFRDHRAIRSVNEIYATPKFRERVETGPAGVGEEAAKETQSLAPVNAELERFAKWVEMIPFPALASIEMEKLQRVRAALEQLDTAVRRLNPSL